MFFRHLARFRIAHIPQVCSAFQIIDQLQNSYRYTITKDMAMMLFWHLARFRVMPQNIDQTKNY